LRDGSEVKSASFVAGYDWPRWNHNLSTQEVDEKKRAVDENTTADIYLDAPTVVYVLFDHPRGMTQRLRIRVWCINGREDDAWRQIIMRFQESKRGATYNLQLHPPTNRDDHIATNELGNLDLADTLVMHVEFESPERIEDLTVEWNVEPTYPIVPVTGRARLVERDVPDEPPVDEPLMIAGLTDLGAVEGEDALQEKAVAIRPDEPDEAE
jgi:hypothetical protein